MEITSGEHGRAAKPYDPDARTMELLTVASEEARKQSNECEKCEAIRRGYVLDKCTHTVSFPEGVEATFWVQAKETCE